MTKLSGGQKHSKRLASLLKIQDDMPKILLVAGGLIQTEATLSITRGSVSGKNHVASRPGEAPNRDTGVLDGSIKTKLISQTKAEVSADAPYAVALEYGTADGKLQERPFMRPAVRKEGGKFKELVATQVKKRAKG